MTEHEEYADFFRQYNRRLINSLKHGRRLTVEDAEDIASETWRNVWRARAAWRRDCSFWTWLCGTARRVAISMYRQHSRLSECEIEPAILYSRDSSIEAIIDARIQAGKVPAILKMRHMLGYTDAELIGMGEHDPGNRIRRAALKFVTGKTTTAGPIKELAKRKAAGR